MARPRSKTGIDPIVEQAVNETKRGLDEHSKREQGYNRSYEIYRASKRPTAEPWQSRLRVKYGMQNLDTAMVNMASSTPRCRILPRSPMHIAGAKAFQQAFDYFVQEDHVSEKAPVTTQQGLIYGVTVGKTHWLYREGSRWTRGMDGQPVEVPVIAADRPSYEPWDVYDAWWDPDARSVDNAAWIILRSWLSKQQLEENACTVPGEHNPLDCDGLYHNVEQLLQAGPSSTRTATAQENATGGAQNLRKDRFELWEVWRDNRLTVVGNKQVLLRDCPNPHWHGKKPIAIASTRPDLFKMQGIPETELVADLQDALNTLLNMRFDNLHLTVMRGFTYREGGATDPNTIILKPRFLWPVTDHDDIKAVEVPPLPPEAFEEEQALLAHMRDVTGITPYITGAGTTGAANQATATGVSILNSAASALLRFKARQVQIGVWQRVFEQWGADIQQFFDKPLWVRLTDNPKSVEDFAQVDPQSVLGEYDYILQGTEESLSKQVERQEALSLLGAFAPLAQTGIVNFRPLLERVAVAFDIPNPDDLFAQQPASRAAAPFANFGSQGGNTPLPAGVGNGQTLLQGRDMPGIVQQAIGQQ